MQLYRPYKGHGPTARFLDDRRLDEQITQALEIAEVCIQAVVNKIKSSPLLKHPIVKHIYNNGRPYLPDLLAYIDELYYEYRKRGLKATPKREKVMESIRTLVHHRPQLWSNERIPPYFHFGDVESNDPKAVFALYQKLLKMQWDKELKRKRNKRPVWS